MRAEVYFSHNLSGGGQNSEVEPERQVFPSVGPDEPCYSGTGQIGSLELLGKLDMGLNLVRLEAKNTTTIIRIVEDLVMLAQQDKARGGWGFKSLSWEEFAKSLTMASGSWAPRKIGGVLYPPYEEKAQQFDNFDEIEKLMNWDGNCPEK